MAEKKKEPDPWKREVKKYIAPAKSAGKKSSGIGGEVSEERVRGEKRLPDDSPIRPPKHE